MNVKYTMKIIYYICRIKKDSPNDAKQSPKKMLRSSPMKRQTKISTEPKKNTAAPSPVQTTPVTTPMEQEKEPEDARHPVPSDNKIEERNGMKLRNLLKLPKAHKWICYEFFYSNIDKYVNTKVTIII